MLFIFAVKAGLGHLCPFCTGVVLENLGPDLLGGHPTAPHHPRTGTPLLDSLHEMDGQVDLEVGDTRL